MPVNLYTQNSELWKNISHIDYLTQFVKAWIPFNAWYKNYYPALKTDKEAIEVIKSNSNNFKNKLESLISGSNTDNDSLLMKNYISNLHYELERHYINNQGRKISFSNIVIEQNQKNHETFSRNSWTYDVIRDSNNFKLIGSNIINRNGVIKLSINQTNGFNISELKADSQYSALNTNQKANLEQCYKEINLFRSISLISNTSDGIDIGNFKFVNDIDNIM